MGLGFAEAARSVVSYLHEHLGFGLWMVTRTEGDDWIVLESEDHGYNVQPGTVFSWADSFCSQMVLGRGPRVAPQSRLIPAYASAPIAQQVEIGAYIGVPLTQRDGSLFGTLCAIDPAEQSPVIQKDLPLVELLASLLSTILETEREAANRARHAELMATVANTDALTGVMNRRGWDEIVNREEDRCRLFGDPAAIISIDLDGLKAANDLHGHATGDQLIRGAADVLRSTVREPDAVARVGGDEFAVLGIGCDKRRAQALLARIRAAFSEAGIAASAGFDVRSPRAGLGAAWHDADAAMYADKRQRRSQLT
jgi:diguanylate cyclase (GGDEF)-like protein